jgi:dolichol-phosphate mannosyltransferase
MTLGAGSLLVVPTYNEAPNIESMLQLIFQSDPTLNLLVVDDDSPDGTGEIVDKQALIDDRIQVLHRKSKSGLGSAYLEGFRRGLDQGAEKLLEMDADMSHDPADLPRMIEAAGGADVVIGSRYIDGGEVQGWSRRRHLLSRGANFYARVLLGFPIRDSTSGFRCYRREVLEAIGLETVRSEGYAFQIDMTYRAWKLGFKVAEIPIVFKERRVGESKMSSDIIREGMVSVTRWGLRDLSQRRTQPAERTPGPPIA